MKFLVDEMSDGLDEKIQKLGYQAESVKKLRVKEPKFAHDVYILNYAKENQFVFITKNKEPGKACGDLGIPCIWISDDLIFEKIIKPELSKFV